MSRVATMSQSSIVAFAGNIARYVNQKSQFISVSQFDFPLSDCFIASISSKLSCLCRTIDRSVFKPIVQISVIDKTESTDCHLLAVTHAGKDDKTVKKVIRVCWIPTG